MKISLIFISEDVSKIYPDETELQRALKDKDVAKLEDIVVVEDFLLNF